jgi:hypothetical protein
VYEDTMCFEVNQDADKFHIFMKKIQNTY